MVGAARGGWFAPLLDGGAWLPKVPVLHLTDNSLRSPISSTLTTTAARLLTSQSTRSSTSRATASSSPTANSTVRAAPTKPITLPLLRTKCVSAHSTLTLIHTLTECYTHPIARLHHISLSYMLLPHRSPFNSSWTRTDCISYFQNLSVFHRGIQGIDSVSCLMLSHCPFRNTKGCFNY